MIEYISEKVALFIVRDQNVKEPIPCDIKQTRILPYSTKLNELDQSIDTLADAIEASKLIEAGFEYVLTTPTSQMIFKKRK